MPRHYLLWLVALAGLPVLEGQTQVDLRTQSKSIDFTAAPTTKPVKTGTALPATCSQGALFFETTAPAGANLFGCTATNTWSLQTGGAAWSFSAASGAPTGACTVGAAYFDTTNGDTWFCENPSTWKKVLTTVDTGPFVMTGQNGANPPSPTAGSTALFLSSSAKLAQSIDDGGNLGTMVRPVDCSGGGQFVRKINPDGTLTCASLPPVTYNFPAGAGSNTSPQAGAWWQDGNTAVICPAGTPFQCALHWNSGGNLLAVTTSVPHAWVSGTVSVTLKYQGDGTGNTVQPAVAGGCASNGGAFAFNAGQSFASQTTSGANYFITTLPALTMTGCSADSLLVLRFSRADTGGFLNLAQASIAFNLP